MKKSTRQIKYLVVHCSATPEGRNHTAKDIDLWHRQRGFDGIGYNYIIRLDGTVEEGRDVNKIPTTKKASASATSEASTKTPCSPKTPAPLHRKKPLKSSLLNLKKCTHKLKS